MSVKKKTKVKVGMVFLFFFLFVLENITYGNLKIEEVEFDTGYVIADVLNVRQGPDKGQEVIEVLKKNDTVTMISKLEQWYIIQTPSGKVGCVSVEYIGEKVLGIGGETEDGVTEITEMENTILKLVNEKRKEQNLIELTIENELQNVARLKAKEMVEKGYFSHISPEYGSPFEMMSKMGVKYKVAGENIAGNISEEEAVKAWMNSEGHRDNILDNGYNYTGIGIASSPKYGKIFVQMFIGK